MTKENLKLSLFSISFGCVLSLIGCTNSKREADATIRHIQNTYKADIHAGIKRIFYINDVGCGTCTQVFSNYILNNVDDVNSLVIINSKGINVDMQEFRKKEFRYPENVTLIYNSRINEPVIPYLCVMYLSHCRVDTVIEITAEKLYEQLSNIGVKHHPT